MKIIQGKVAFLKKVVDHPLKAHAPAVIRGIYSCNPVIMKVFNLMRKYNASAAGEDFYMPPALFMQ